MSAPSSREEALETTLDLAPPHGGPETSELRTAYLEHVLPRIAKQRAYDVAPERWERVKEILGDERWTPMQTRQTLGALYNAVVRDEDYRKAKERQAERRLERVWFGSGREIKL